MIEYIKGNILDFKGFNVFAHSISIKGYMGKGLALQIKEEYPKVYEDVQESLKKNENVLGNFVVSVLYDGKRIVSLYTQEDVGTDKRMVDYQAFIVSLETLEKVLREKTDKYTLALPYKLSCGLAGGDWRIVKAIIESIFVDSPVKVVIVEYVKKNKEEKKN